MVWRARRLRGAPVWSPSHNLHRDYERLAEKLRHKSKYPGYVSILQDADVYPYLPDPAEDLPGAQGPVLMRGGAIRELRLNCASKQNVFDAEFLTAAQGQLFKWGRSVDIDLICVSTKYPDVGNPYHEPNPAFSVGMDLQGLYDSRADEPALIENLRAGYRLIGTVANMLKPCMMMVNGPAVGAGAALAFFGNMSAVEPGSVAAFPECELGLAPGYGATYFLNRYTTPAFGMMLALTGKRLRYWDLIHCGLATNAMDYTNVPYLATTLADGQGSRGLAMLMSGIADFEPEQYGPYTLRPYLDLIERCFAGKDSVEDICDALKAENLHFAHYLLRKITNNCPLSVKVAFRLMKDAEERELAIDYMCEHELADDERRYLDRLGLDPNNPTAPDPGFFSPSLDDQIGTFRRQVEIDPDAVVDDDSDDNNDDNNNNNNNNNNDDEDAAAANSYDYDYAAAATEAPSRAPTPSIETILESLSALGAESTPNNNNDAVASSTTPFADSPAAAQPFNAAQQRQQSVAKNDSDDDAHLDFDDDDDDDDDGDERKPIADSDSDDDSSASRHGFSAAFMRRLGVEPSVKPADWPSDDKNNDDDDDDEDDDDSSQAEAARQVFAPIGVRRVRQALLPERGAHLLGLQKCFEAEYRATLRLLQGPEFAEAVEKRVLDRSGKSAPVWRFQRLADVPNRLVDEIVAPFRDPSDELDRMNPYSHKGANYRSHLRDFYKMRHIAPPSERAMMFYAERHLFGGRLRD